MKVWLITFFYRGLIIAAETVESESPFEATKELAAAGRWPVSSEQTFEDLMVSGNSECRYRIEPCDARIHAGMRLRGPA